ncbi:hypothetical protein GQ55_1G085900 [Panicum hallii var. hallii]|uniref:Uncharacterized protein n=1 Tax=Panicum hallii var. hallii TaxID=1504633 RepID=A0A2T7F3Q0_9POAL|nr:hypothetical protein GQ55_1G085900 [Panicum hallii var. hallii]
MTTCKIPLYQGYFMKRSYRKRKFSLRRPQCLKFQASQLYIGVHHVAWLCCTDCCIARGKVSDDRSALAHD